MILKIIIKQYLVDNNYKFIRNKLIKLKIMNYGNKILIKVYKYFFIYFINIIK